MFEPQDQVDTLLRQISKTLRSEMGDSSLLALKTDVETLWTRSFFLCSDREQNKNIDMGRLGRTTYTVCKSTRLPRYASEEFYRSLIKGA